MVLVFGPRLCSYKAVLAASRCDIELNLGYTAPQTREQNDEPLHLLVRPILEADHAGVLELAEQKLAANSKKLLSPVEKLSVEKLTKQVAWIKRTIDVCNQVLEVRRGVE